MQGGQGDRFHHLDDEGGEGLESAVWLGVQVTSVPALVTAQLGLTPGMGLAVERVVSGSPAERAGLRRYDILTKFDDQLLVNAGQLQVLVRSKVRGTVVQLTGLRKGRERMAPATLDTRHPEMIREPLPADWVPPLPTDVGGPIRDVLIDRNRSTAEPHVRTKTVGAQTRQVVTTDVSGTYELKVDGENRRFKAVRTNGEVVFEGAVGTRAEQAGLSSELRERLKSLEAILASEPVLPPLPPRIENREERMEIRIRKGD